MIIPALTFLCKWSFAKRTVLQMTKSNGTKEQELLQMIIQMIQPPTCSSVPLILVIRRTVLFANDHLQRNGRARRRPNHPDDHLQVTDT